MNGSQPPQGQGQAADQAAPQQQQQQQQQQPQRSKFPLFRPEQMRTLPEKFSAEEKKKWENGLAQLYKQMENNPQESQHYRDAYKKIHDFSATLYTKIHSSGTRPGVPNQARPPVQGGQPSQQQTAQQPQPSQSSQLPQQQGQPQNMPPRPAPVPSQSLRDHVNNFPYVPPAGFPAGSEQATQIINQMKGKYLKALMGMDAASQVLKNIDATTRAREAEGKPLTVAEAKEYQLKREQAQRSHGDCERFVMTFRKQQKDLGANAGAPQQSQQGVQSQLPQAPPAIAGPPRPTMNLQQPASQTMQTTQSVQAAMQAANQQHMNGARPNVPNPAAPNAVPQQQNEQQSQTQNTPQQSQNAPVSAGQQPGMPPQAPSFQPQIKQEQSSQQPQILNVPPHASQVPHQQPMQQRQMPMGGGAQQNSSHPATPQSATAPQQNMMSNGIPKPLSHQDAVAQAQRTYSSSQMQANTPMGHGHPTTTMQRDAVNIKQPLMPIPKQLPPNAIAPPQPVHMPPSRPTYTGGPSGSGAGLMQQPAMTKTPGFVIDGDAERVLNKRKLDELVRQVTGGGESLNDADGLTPEVEDVSQLDSTSKSRPHYCPAHHPNLTFSCRTN